MEGDDMGMPAGGDMGGDDPTKKKPMPGMPGGEEPAAPGTEGGEDTGAAQ